MLLGSLLSCFFIMLYFIVYEFLRDSMWKVTKCGQQMFLGDAHTFISHLNLYAIASTLSFCELSVRWKKLRNSTRLFFVCVKDWSIQPEITRKIEPATNEARSEISDIKWEGMTIKEFRTLFFYVLWGRLGRRKMENMIFSRMWLLWDTHHNWDWEMFLCLFLCVCLMALGG